MEVLPSNSHKAREQASGREAKETSAAEPRVAGPVVSGKVIRRKTSLGKRTLALLFRGETKEVFGYVGNEILLPALRDLIVDIVREAVDRKVNGDSRTGIRRSGSRLSTNGGYTNYNRPTTTSSAPWNNPRREEPRSISRQARATHNFDEIVLNSRAEAATVLEALGDLIARYDHASVADLYALVGISESYTDGQWGWVDLTAAEIRSVRDGYQLLLPPTEKL